MFDRRTGAMIALSLLVLSPTVVFADAERNREYTSARPGDYQLMAAAPSTPEPSTPLGIVTEPGWTGQWNGVDFPVGGNNQFAHADMTHGPDSYDRLSGETSQR
jgi:hypothetical protein